MVGVTAAIGVRGYKYAGIWPVRLGLLGDFPTRLLWADVVEKLFLDRRLID